MADVVAEQFRLLSIVRAICALMSHFLINTAADLTIRNNNNILMELQMYTLHTDRRGGMTSSFLPRSAPVPKIDPNDEEPL